MTMDLDQILLKTNLQHSIPGQYLLTLDTLIIFKVITSDNIVANDTSEADLKLLECYWVNPAVIEPHYKKGHHVTQTNQVPIEYYGPFTQHHTDEFIQLFEQRWRKNMS